VFGAGASLGGDEFVDAPPKPAMLSVDRVVGYEQIARIALDGTPPPGVQVGGNTVSFTDTTGLTFGRRYVYVVTAEDATGRSSPPPSRLSAPSAPPPSP